MDIKKYQQNYHIFPKLTMIKKMWFFGYYDGPLSGMCLVNGEKCWFEHLEDWSTNNDYPEDDDNFEPPWYRRYLIYKLTNEQLIKVEADHEEFRRRVGTHTDYAEDGKRSYFKYTNEITPESVKQYFLEKKGAIDLTPTSDECILGWYEY